ncbi:MAG TPA: hypothetical protein VF843_13510 [Streptosporangiaceae bacterium]
MSVTSRNQAASSAAEVQRRARKIAEQASKLAEQAGPLTKSAAMTARHGADAATEWATPHVTRARSWMAVQANRGSVSVQETVGPKVSEMLATTARKLDPPTQKARRLPKVLAGTAMLAAGAAAAGAMAIKNRQPYLPPPLPPRPATTTGTSTDESSAVLNPSADVKAASSENAANGTSRSR